MMTHQVHKQASPSIKTVSYELYKFMLEARFILSTISTSWVHLILTTFHFIATSILLPNNMSDYKPTEHGGLRQDGQPDQRVGTGRKASTSTSIPRLLTMKQSLRKERSTLTRLESREVTHLEDQTRPHLLAPVTAGARLRVVSHVQHVREMIVNHAQSLLMARLILWRLERRVVTPKVLY